MKAYGFVIKDVTGGEYIRWFNSNGKLTFPMTGDLRRICVIMSGIDNFRRAFKTAKLLSEEYGFVFKELTEKDFIKKS